VPAPTTETIVPPPTTETIGPAPTTETIVPAPTTETFWYFIVYLLKTTSTYHSVKTISLNNKCRYVGETK